MRTMVALTLCLLASACVQVMDSTPSAIWIKQPLFALDSPDDVAARHCARYNREAVRQGQFGGGKDDFFVPILAYDCR